jgi:hypothetical protein
MKNNRRDERKGNNIKKNMQIENKILATIILSNIS